MDGLLTTDFPQDSQAAQIETSRDAGDGLPTPTCPDRSELGETPATGLYTAVDRALSDLYEDDVSEHPAEEEDSRLIRSFDMIFQLHQRSEEIRAHLENIDRLLLESRTLAGLVEGLTAALEGEFDLAAARILFRHDHPAAEIFKMAAPSGSGIIPRRFIENESLFPSGPFVLDDPNGELSQSLFGEAAPLLCSAIAANLCVDGDELGLLCLGSEDPNRYCGGMNTDLIASLADKIALGIQNAWDHECRAQNAVAGCALGIYSEPFFREYLAKEFNRSWRTRNVFSLLALSWTGCPEVESVAQIAEQILAQVRSSDVVAEGDSLRLWILLPETDLDGARVVAERLSQCMTDKFDEGVALHCGITAFSKDTTALPILVSRAQAALKEAEKAQNSTIVTKT
jgi:uncharacterized protein YigA (DUF484 family)/GGDEF domain-containing protein